MQTFNLRQYIMADDFVPEAQMTCYVVIDVKSTIKKLRVRAVSYDGKDLTFNSHK